MYHIRNLLQTLIVFIVLYSLNGYAGSNTTFIIIPLGTAGGIIEDNLSAYLIAEETSKHFIMLDAGTVMSGLLKPQTQQSLHYLGFKSSGMTLALDFFRNKIKAYILSHAHLDHIAGLVLASSIDNNKTIFGTEATLNEINKNIFNWKIWPNFTNQGQPPLLNRYQYRIVEIGKRVSIPGTSFRMEAMTLSHGYPYLSNAFLLEAHGNYLLYLGDTGADAIEKNCYLAHVWEKVAPLIQQKKLKAIFIEVSFTNRIQDKFLFGHLNPKWLLIELEKLAQLVNRQHPEKALKNLNIMITHIKPEILDHRSSAQIIAQELKQNTFGAKFTYPQQGQIYRY